MKVVEEILSWTKTLPDWQSDAVRRIWINNNLSESDESELFTFLNEQIGLVPENKDQQPVTFSKTDIGSATIHGQQVVLKSLQKLTSVNAIPPTERLDFGDKGLTIIYGDNSAGKSGYSRVLKKSCRARGVADRIYANIYDSKAGNEVAKATFTVQINGDKPFDIGWEDGKPAPDCLGNIAVFDSKTARVYVNEANKVSYIPYGLDVFTKLATLCRSFREKIQTELDALSPMSETIAKLVGQELPIKTITSKTTSDEIDKVAPFSKEDSEELSNLSKIIADYKANDPVKRAQEIRRQKGRIDGLRRDLVTIASQLSTKVTSAYRKASDEAVQANKAAMLASEKAFAGEPLEGTGGDVWRFLFDSARKFSEQEAYKYMPFPVVVEGSLCVLCQQPLEKDAQDRMQRFWDFVEADITKIAKERTRVVAQSITALKQLNIDVFTKTPQLLEELKELDVEVATPIEQWIKSQSARRDAVIDALESGAWGKVPSNESYPSSALSSLSKRCEMKAKEVEKLADPKSQKKAESEATSFEYRKSVQDNKKSILEWVSRLKKEEMLRKALQAVDTTQITRKGSTLMEQALTKELESALNTEFEVLGVDHLKMKFQRSGSMGNTLHQLQLEDMNQRVNLSEILSEGEHRVVAIASFFAELRTSTHRCGIVFDDPVSSLDHYWRTRVASRLTAEAKNRQVIVFTHDIVFLLELEQQAKEQKVELLAQTVYRSDKTAGLNTKDVPWDAKSTKSRIGILKQMFQELEKLYNEKKLDNYNYLIQVFYGRLRQTWERAIEEVLLNQSVMRFRQGIETKRLNAVTIETQDIEDIEKGMTKSSKWMTGHDKSPAVGSTQLLPKEIKEDLDLIYNFRARVEKRRQK